MPRHQDRSGRGPSADEPGSQAEAEAFHLRVAELSKDMRMSRREAVHMLLKEDNAELVKSNSMAAAQARSEPQRQAGGQGQSKQTGAGRQPAARSPNPAYSYERGGLESNQTNAARHMQAKHRQAKAQQRSKGAEAEKSQQCPSRGRDGPREMSDRSQTQKSRVDRYRELMNASQNQSATRAGPDKGQSRS